MHWCYIGSNEYGYTAYEYEYGKWYGIHITHTVKPESKSERCTNFSIAEDITNNNNQLLELKHFQRSIYVTFSWRHTSTPAFCIPIWKLLVKLTSFWRFNDVIVIAHRPSS